MRPFFIAVFSIASITAHFCAMMHEEVTAWLNSNRDYNKGVELYERYGHYNMVAVMLRMGNERSELHREKLLAVLKEMVTAPPPAPKQFNALPKKTKPNPGNNPPEETDEYLKSLDAKWKPVYTEMATHHSRLLAVDTNEARLALAQRIVNCHEQLVNFWQQRDYYQTNGKPMPKPVKKKARENLTQTDLRKLLNARTARSQYKNKHLPMWQARLRENPTAKNKTKVEFMLKRIEDYNKIIEQYEQEVTGHNT